MDIIKLRLTKRCNLRCSYCSWYSNDPKDRGFMSPDVVKDVSSKYPGARYYIYGGEPTLHPQFNHILDILKNSECNIQSNGTLLHKLELDLNPKHKFSISIHDNFNIISKEIFKLKSIGALESVDIMCTRDNVYRSLKLYHTLRKLLPINIQNIFEDADYLAKLTRGCQNNTVASNDQLLSINEMLGKNISFKGWNCACGKTQMMVDHLGCIHRCDMYADAGVHSNISQTCEVCDMDRCYEFWAKRCSGSDCVYSIDC